MRKAALQRFEEKFIVTPGCWLWQHAHNRQGYGFFDMNGRKHGAHRASYLLYVGEIPAGLLVRHKCDNPPCVNPDHLEVGTASQNSQDREDRRRGFISRGEANGNSKLAEEQVFAIRKDTRLLQTIADDFGVSMSLVHAIKTRRVWAHL